MLIPINSNQISKLIPSVGTGSQFKYTLGNPRKILQRVIISSIGGFISLIISTTGDQTNNFWLLLCVIFFLYIISFGVIASLLGGLGLDFVTAISGAASAIGNVGPGLGDIIGPSGSYQSIPDLGKLILCAGMILGRLEIFAILVMFSPLFWKN